MAAEKHIQEVHNTINENPPQISLKFDIFYFNTVTTILIGVGTLNHSKRLDLDKSRLHYNPVLAKLDLMRIALIHFQIWFRSGSTLI